MLERRSSNRRASTSPGSFSLPTTYQPRWRVSRSAANPVEAYPGTQTEEAPLICPCLSAPFLDLSPGVYISGHPSGHQHPRRAAPSPRLGACGNPVPPGRLLCTSAPPCSLGPRESRFNPPLSRLASPPASANSVPLGGPGDRQICERRRRRRGGGGRRWVLRVAVQYVCAREGFRRTSVCSGCWRERGGHARGQPGCPNYRGN